MRNKWIATVALVLVAAACGTDEAATSDSAATTTTLSPWRFADDEPGAFRANQPLTDAEQIAQAAAQRDLEEWLAVCTENVPKLSFIGHQQSRQIWNNARQQDDALFERCVEIGRDDADTKALIERAVRQNQGDLRQVDLSTTTTTTIDPNVAFISIKCPPRETEAVGSWRAEFDVEQSSPTDIRQWGIDYGDGRSYTAGSQEVAEEELYWHNYYETGAFEVTVWITDADDERTEASCTVRWSN